MSRFADWLDKTFIPTNQERLRKAYNITSNALHEVNIPFIQGEGGLFVWVDFREVRCILYAIQSSLWWGVCMCGGGRGLGRGGGTVEEGAHERSCVLITAFWKVTISMMMNLQIITQKTWNLATARPVNRSSNIVVLLSSSIIDLLRLQGWFMD